MGCQAIGDCEEARGQLEKVAMEMCSELQLPVRLVRIPASELHLGEAYRSEVQMWSEPFQQYIQIGHVSVLGDFTSRRLNIHTVDQSGGPTHMAMVRTKWNLDLMSLITRFK
ncbi:serine--tRNA ligase-like [Liolophura sinensis]|uniref:serine--tRNA ligase-like n=1 Tax=Liolophura sinensis TaxID=3198878 RepID=UPI0031594729